MLVLASKSPRRIELLKDLGLAFTVLPSQKEERILPGAAPYEVARSLAQQKAQDVFSMQPNAVVIGADTVVSYEGEIFGKPAGDAQAFYMLSRLSGNWHDVYTGVCIKSKDKQVCTYEATRVKFKNLSQNQIETYIETREPMDKAGAYGIQGMGRLFVEKIEGDFFNVVGLPVCRLGILLEECFGIHIL